MLNAAFRPAKAGRRRGNRLAGDECPEGKLTENDNHNGSARNIAGIFNEAKTVLGLMPHPEDATDPLLGGTDGQGLFDGLAGALGA